MIALLSLSFSMNCRLSSLEKGILIFFVKEEEREKDLDAGEEGIVDSGAWVDEERLVLVGEFKCISLKESIGIPCVSK